MALVRNNYSLGTYVSSKLIGASRWVNGLFGIEKPGFTSDYAIENVPLIDERLRPQAQMPTDEIDVLTRLQMSNVGLMDARLVTAQSHPELYAGWTELCHRAGYEKVPQLIIARSEMPNAFEFSDGEMIITTGLLKMLNLRETIGVLGHELAHGRNEHKGVRETTMNLFAVTGALLGNFVAKMQDHNAPEEAAKATRGIAGAWQKFIDFMVPKKILNNHTSLLGYGAYIGSGVTAGVIAANQISVRPTELQADLEGVSISGDPYALASALAKLETLSEKRGPVNRFFNYVISGYPTTEARIANIQRAAAEVPFNPVQAVRNGPVPQVRDVTHAERLESAINEPVKG